MTAPTKAGRYDPTDPALRYGVRHAALTSATAGVRVRRGSAIPVEQVLLVAATVLFPLGIVFIILGWYGAAHTGRTYAQIDYLISGGLLGLGLSVAGGFMYFGYWLSRQLGESRRQTGLTLQSLQRIEDLLGGVITTTGMLSAQGGGSSVPAARPAASVPAGPPLRRSDAAPVRSGPVPGAVPLDYLAAEAPAAPANGSATATRTRRATKARPATADPTGEVPAVGPLLVATPRGTLLHRPECPVVAKRQDLRSVPAGSDGFGYCAMCDAAEVLS